MESDGLVMTLVLANVSTKCLAKNDAFVTGATVGPLADFPGTDVSTAAADSGTDAGVAGSNGTGDVFGACVGPGVGLCCTAGGKDDSGTQVDACVVGANGSGADDCTAVGADTPGADVGTGAGARSVRGGGTECTCSDPNHDAPALGLSNDARGKDVRGGDGNADVRGSLLSVKDSAFGTTVGFARGLGKEGMAAGLTVTEACSAWNDASAYSNTHCLSNGGVSTAELGLRPLGVSAEAARRRFKPSRYLRIVSLA